MSNVTVGELLTRTTKEFANADIESARLDSLLILEHILGLDRSVLLAYPDKIITSKELKLVKKCVQKRTTHTPLAYILGSVEFYGRPFTVTENTLVPRPESEALIELLLSLKLPDKATVVDVGTGSGALAITIKKEQPDLQVTGLDIDNSCLAVAQKNALLLSAHITWIQSDLLNYLPISSQPSAIVANLPYVPEHYAINRAAEHEPPLALFGGVDGLDYYRELFVQAKNRQTKYVLTESLDSQHATLTAIAKKSSYRLTKTLGLAQLFTLH